MWLIGAILRNIVWGNVVKKAHWSPGWKSCVCRTHEAHLGGLFVLDTTSAALRVSDADGFALEIVESPVRLIQTHGGLGRCSQGTEGRCPSVAIRPLGNETSLNSQTCWDGVEFTSLLATNQNLCIFVLGCSNSTKKPQTSQTFSIFLGLRWTKLTNVCGARREIIEGHAQFEATHNLYQ